MNVIKKSPIIALALVPLFFLFHNYNELFGFIPVSQLIYYAVIIYASLIIGYLIFRWMKVPPSKALLILFITSIFLLFFDPIASLFKRVSFGSFFGSNLFLVPVCIIIIVFLIRRILRGESVSSNVITFLNIVMIFLFASELAIGFSNFNQYRKNKNLIYPYNIYSEKYTPSQLPDSAKPDIYFIVFDEYTNNKTLKKLWKFDNTPITRWLAANRFYVPENTHANYSVTIYSVSSTFNMNYIDAKKGSDATVTRNILQANQSVSDNETFNILQQENYSINFIAPFKNRIRENGLGKWFDYLIDHQIDMQTLPGKIIAHIKWHSQTGKWSDLDDDWYENILNTKLELLKNTLDQIKKSTDSNTDRQPHFVYGHFMIPHEPHLSFDSAGAPIPDQRPTNLPPFATYPAQISYANELMKDLVSYILQHNKRNTIIIVEGDHGFREFNLGPGWFMRTSDSLKRFFLPNFCAIYFPEKNYSRLYDHMSPVNTFRIIFDQYFRQQFPLLKDSGIVVKDD
ncbi:MAG: hypothetical protein C5B59_16790 [Bacteroidetes bacterium]|nr:MAG: hypothetical protein C5B59_16790 [Bacteroidota bacterium]